MRTIRFTVSFIIVFFVFANCFAQNVASVVKYEFEKLHENKGISINISETETSKGKVFIKFTVTNKTASYVIYRPDESELSFPGKKFNFSDSYRLLPAGAVQVLEYTISSQHEFRMHKFDFVPKGIYLESGIKSRTLPEFSVKNEGTKMNENDIEIGLKNVKKIAKKEAELEFEILYTGSNLILVDLSKIELQIGKQKWAPIKQSENFKLIQNERKLFTLEYEVSKDDPDLRIAFKDIVWNGAFEEALFSPVEFEVVNFESEDGIMIDPEDGTMIVVKDYRKKMEKLAKAESKNSKYERKKSDDVTDSSDMKHTTVVENNEESSKGNKSNKYQRTPRTNDVAEVSDKNSSTANSTSETDAETGEVNKYSKYQRKPDSQENKTESDDSKIDNKKKFQKQSSKALVEEFINAELKVWAELGKYETTENYKIRVNSQTRKNKIEELKNKKVNELASKAVTLKILSTEYDADNQFFKINFKNIPSIYVKIPLTDAEGFDANLASIDFEDANFAIVGENDFALLNTDLTNPSNNKNYRYNSKDVVVFKKVKIENNFEDIQLDLSGEAIVQAEGSEIIIAEDLTIIDNIDDNIPKNGVNNSKTYALIIGNENYSKYQTGLTTEANVDYARNDAEIFAKYCNKTLGLPAENIVLLTDATSGKMSQEIERLVLKAKYKPGELRLIVYYAGHGFYNEAKESYIMPVDISSSNVNGGIKLTDFYDKLTEHPTERVTVFLDACFSGGGRNQGLLAARAVKIKAQETTIRTGNLIVFAASSGNQESLPYKEKKHGLFSYYLIKKLQESKGEVNYGELAEYLTKEVPFTAVDKNSKEQTPIISISSGIENVWKGWNFTK